MRQISWIIVLVVVGIALFLIILNFRKGKNLWEAVPEGSAIVLQTDFEGLKELPDLFFVQQLKKDHQLFGKFNLPKKQKILTVLQTGTPEGFNALFITKSPSEFDHSMIFDDLQVSSLQGVEVFRNKDIAFTRYKGLLLLAPFAMQVESAIQQLNSGKADWVKVEPITSDAESNLFLFPKNIDLLFTSLMQPTFRKRLHFLQEFEGWLSGNWKKTESGFQWKGTMQEKSRDLNSQPFKDSKVLSILPNNTTFCFRGKLDFEQLEQQLHSALSDNPIPNWFGEEMIVGNTSNRNGNFLFLEITQEAKKALISMEKSGDLLVKQHFMFATYSLNQTHYFTYDDRYIYIFKGEKPLQNWINKYSAGKVLQNEAAFQQLQSQTTDLSFNFAYFNTRNLQTAIEKNVKAEWQERALKDADLIGNNAHLLATFRPLENDLIIEINAINPKEQNTYAQADVLQGIELKTTIAIPPRILSFKTQNFILIQDEEHRLYAFDQSGTLFWEIELEDRIISDIHLLEDGNLLFNTAFRVHSYDLEGQTKEGFPFELQPKAILGLCLIDFTKSGFYHYLIACENGSIYGYDLAGNPLEGWTPKDSIGTNITALHHFQNAERDFIVVAADSTIQVYNRLGDLRFPIYSDTTLWNAKVAFQAAEPFPRIVATDNWNKIHILNLEGQHFKLSLKKKLGKNFQFLFFDVWGDERKDYIYLTNNQLQMYAYDESNQFDLRSEMKFEHVPSEVFEVNYRGKNWIGMVSKTATRISLHDGGGKIHTAFPLAGDQVFTIEEELLITAEKKSVQFYILE